MSDEADPLATLAAALQDFANHEAGEPVLVDTALVVWELITYDDDGDVQRRITYAVPTHNFSMSSSMGLVDAAKELLRRDTLGCQHDTDDD